jgi:hypothetical protein
MELSRSRRTADPHGLFATSRMTLILRAINPPLALRRMPRRPAPSRFRLDGSEVGRASSPKGAGLGSREGGCK